MEDSAPRGLRLVEKTVEVLNLLEENGELTIAQLSTVTGEPRSSMYRLLSRLEQLELVEAGASRGQFRLGTQLLRWGAAMQRSLDIRDRALPALTRLQAETGLTIYLVVRRGWQGVCIERLEGTRVASLAMQLGGSLPLHSGTALRALLAFEPESVWQEYVDHEPLVKFTERTPTTPAELFALLRTERERGVTRSDGDVTPGIASFGAPVFDHRGAVAGAISASGLRESVLGENSHLVEQAVRDAAAVISQALGAKAAVEL